MPRKRIPQSTPAQVNQQVHEKLGVTPPEAQPGLSPLESEGIPLTEAQKVDIPGHPLASAILNAGLLDPAPPKSSFMEGILKCHTCGRTGEEDLAECPNAQLPNFTCPTPTAIDPDTDVVLHSGVLGVIRTVPIASLVKGHAKNYLPGCHTDDCGYKVLHPKGS